MLRRNTFSYTVQARCSRADALALLGDLSRRGELHPVIVRARRRRPRPGALASYAITGRLTAGSLRFPVTYQADVLIATEDEVVTVARQWPATTVRNRTRLKEESPDVVRLDVEITVSAPAPLFGYAFHQVRAAHLGLASRLGAALDRGPDAPGAG